MKRILVFLLFILATETSGQAIRFTYLTADSIRNSYLLEENWLFYPGDDTTARRVDFNDSNWEAVGNPDLDLESKRATNFKDFNGIGWFRLHIRIDSSLILKPLTLGLRHLGASQVFIDGKNISRYGKVVPADSFSSMHPKSIPLALVFSSAGDHVISVRYANYDAQRNLKVFEESVAGFHMSISPANEDIVEYVVESRMITFILMLLFGIFIALSLQHLFLYLYHWAARSHLYFSLFTFSLSMLFFLPYNSYASEFPDFRLWCTFLVQFAALLACFSLSGFINDLFSHINTLTPKKNLGFIIITCSVLVAAMLRLVDLGLSLLAVVLVVAMAALEAGILVTAAIVTKVKGARIIGTGILFFAAFILFVFILGLLGGSLAINTNNTSGMIATCFLAAAILSTPISMSVYLAWNFSAINRDLKSQLQTVKDLSEKTIEQEIEKKRILESRQEELEREVAVRTSEVTDQKERIERQHEELKKAKKQSDDLLLNILPEEIADELKQTGTTEARFYDQVTVLFTDFVNFTQAGEHMSPKELVDELHTCFKAFDEICTSYGIEKIKTIGDAYLAVCGVPAADPHHASKVVCAALEIRDFMEKRKTLMGERSFNIRVGIHSGAVVAGIVGVKKFAYDIWGDTVNTAARMEQSGEGGKINISGATYDLIRAEFQCIYRGEIEAKNKGKMGMYFVEGKITSLEA